MLGDYIKKHFADIKAAEPVSEASRRSGYNGTVLQVDISTPADFVDADNLIVVNDGCLDLTQSIAYALWTKSVKGTDKVSISEASVVDSAIRIGQLTVLWTIYRILSAAAVTLSIRASDTVELPFPKRILVRAKPNPDFIAEPIAAAEEAKEEAKAGEGGAGVRRPAALPRFLEFPDDPTGTDLDILGSVEDGAYYSEIVAGGAPAGYVEWDHPIWDMAKRMEGYFMDSTHKAAQESMASQGKMILHAFYAVAIHRKVCEGHSWFTNETMKEKSNTYRALGVAGSAHEEFQSYMKLYGHDIVHHLTDSSLAGICDAMNEPISPVSPTEDPPRKRVTAALEYNGVQIRGKQVSEVLIVSESARERWPVGELGKSAIILGLKAVSGMVEAITSRVLVSGTQHLTSDLKRIRDFIAGPQVKRDTILLAREAFTSIIVYSVGFLSASGKTASMEAESIKAVIRANTDDFDAGKAMGVTVLQAPINLNALASALIAKLTSVVSAMSKFSDTTTTVSVAEDINEAVIGETEAAISHARMLETLKATRA